MTRFLAAAAAAAAGGGGGVRAVSLDVTGTLVAFRGSLGSLYSGAVHEVVPQQPPPLPDDVARGFREAYRHWSAAAPCFGFGRMSSKMWWKKVVLMSLQLAGHTYAPPVADAVFERIYGVFGTLQAYRAFDDSLPFLRWCRQRRLKVGILSNSAEQYRDKILPQLGLSEYLDFILLARDLGYEKPSREIFEAAFECVQKLLGERVRPEHILHVGDSVSKDYQPAIRFGMQAILVDRFASDWAKDAKKQGFHVVSSLEDVRNYLSTADKEFERHSTTL